MSSTAILKKPICEKSAYSLSQQIQERELTLIKKPMIYCLKKWALFAKALALPTKNHKSPVES